MFMSAEDVVRRIVAVRGDLSVEEIRARIEAKKAESGGYLADEVAARIVAAELGVKLPKEAPRLEVAIKDLVSGLGKVTVVGRVVAVYPPRVFRSPLGTERKTASLLIADKTGMLRVVLWNDEVELLRALGVERGKIIRVVNGYVSRGRDGKLELHLGRRGEIEVDPEDVKGKNYPLIPRLKRIAQILPSERNRRISVVGRIVEKAPLSTFERRDGSTGRLLRFTLVDETGAIPVAAWNERAEALEKAELDGFLLLVNVKVRERSDKRLELHVDHRTYVESLTEEALKQIFPEEKPIRVSEIAKEGKIPVLEGRVVTKPFLKEVKTSRGETVKVAMFEIADENRSIWVSAWRTLAEAASKLRVGDKVRMENVRVKKGFGDKLEITTTSSTRIKVQREKGEE